MPTATGQDSMYNGVEKKIVSKRDRDVGGNHVLPKWDDPPGRNDRQRDAETEQ